jgi:hypothetical protein
MTAAAADDWHYAGELYPHKTNMLPYKYCLSINYAQVVCLLLDSGVRVRMGCRKNGRANAFWAEGAAPGGREDGGVPLPHRDKCRRRYKAGLDGF